MKATGTITLDIDGKTKKVGFAFNMKSRRLLMQKRGLEYFSQLGELIQQMIPEKDTEPSLTQLYIFADVFMAAIEAYEGPVEKLDSDELLEQLMRDTDQLKEFMSLFGSTQEQEKKGGKTSSRGKSKKK